MLHTPMKVLLGLALALLLPAPVTAQTTRQEAGEFTVLGALYGTERHHVDVTRRLREETRRDHKPFRVGNDVLGVDPAAGVRKTLRLYARGPHGRDAMFEYGEGSTVVPGWFRGWNLGERWDGHWSINAGEFLILSASYGTEQHHVDVTDRLKELARRDHSFHMGNASFGVDPDVGRVKALRIYARGPEGKVRMFEFREGSLVDGSRFRGWGGDDWGHAKDRWRGHWDGEERGR